MLQVGYLYAGVLSAVCIYLVMLACGLAYFHWQFTPYGGWNGQLPSPSYVQVAFDAECKNIPWTDESEFG